MPALDIVSASVFNNDGVTARDSSSIRREQRVFEIAEGTFRKRDGAVAVRTLLPGVIDQIDEWHNNPDFKLRGLATGFHDFDKVTGGLRPGDLVIIAGRPSMGKTTLAMNIAEYAAVNPTTQGAAVAIFQHGNAGRSAPDAHALLGRQRSPECDQKRPHRR